MKDAKNKSIIDFAKEVADHLPGWEPVPPGEPIFRAGEHIFGKIKGPGGLAITFRKDGERVEVVGEYPRLDGSLLPWNDRPETITVGLNRDGKSAAKDIERRYLPAYEEAYLRGKNDYDERTAYQGLSEANATALAKLVNGRVFGEKKDHFSAYMSEVPGNKSKVRVEGRASANRIDLKIEDISPEKAPRRSWRISS